MTTYLRPCVSLVSWSPSNAGMFGPYSYTRWRNPEFYSRSRTTWVRVWASWQYLQPIQGYTDPASDATNLGTDSRIPAISRWPGMTPQGYLGYLTDQIRRAKNDGHRVILTFHQCPLWANGPTRAS